MVAIIHSCLNDFDLFLNEGLRKETNADVFDLYGVKTVFGKLFLRLTSYIYPKLYNKFLSRKANKIKGYDTVIYINSSAIPNVLVDKIKKNNPNARLILFILNKVTSIESYNYMFDMGWEIWSFDENDSKTLGLKYNAQFYPSIKLEKNIKPLNDLFFIGYDKGRLNNLVKINDVAHDKNLTSKIIVRKWSKFSPILFINKKLENGIVLTYKEVSYKRILKYITQSKCIIELVMNGQVGFTMRVMESLFFERKLITNNSAVKNQEFYNKNNIFILDEDMNLDGIEEFLNSPYVPIPKEKIEKYAIQSWYQNFFKEKV